MKTLTAAELGKVRVALQSGADASVYANWEAGRARCQAAITIIDAPSAVDGVSGIINQAVSGFPACAEFRSVIEQLPQKHWAKYDLSAVRLGWEFARATKGAPQ
jgi:hypothetical protein